MINKIIVYLIGIILISGCTKDTITEFDPFGEGKMRYIKINNGSEDVVLLNTRGALVKWFYPGNFTVSKFEWETPAFDGYLKCTVSNFDFENPPENGVKSKKYYINKNNPNNTCRLGICNNAQAVFRYKGEDYKTNDLGDGHITIESMKLGLSGEFSASFDFVVYEPNGTDSIRFKGVVVDQYYRIN